MVLNNDMSSNALQSFVRSCVIQIPNDTKATLTDSDKYRSIT